MKLFAYSLREYDELPFLEAYAKEKGFEFGWTSAYPTLENANLAKGYDSLLIITTPLDKTLLSRFYELGIKHVATRSIGYDHIDVVSAHEMGMRVGHAAYPPQSVADYTIMLMLMALRKAKFVMNLASVQDFELRGKLGKDISSSTVGIIGTGKIGATVAQHLSGFGCKLIAFDPYPNEAAKAYVDYVSLNELLQSADVITLHAPATAQNYHLIDAAKIEKMKPGVTLVNAARGALIDTQALIQGVESGKIGACALDTIEHEDNLYYLDKSRDVLPNRDRAILDAFPNVIVSPHMAFYSEIDVMHMVQSSCDDLLAFEADKPCALEARYA